MTVFRRELPLSSVVDSPAEASCHIGRTRVLPDRAEVVRRAGNSNLTLSFFFPLARRRGRDGPLVEHLSLIHI